MIAFPEMLVPLAQGVGMAVPDDVTSFDANKYPHFYVYMMIQIGSPINFRRSSHIENARIIAEIPENKIREVSVADLRAMGVT